MNKKTKRQKIYKKLWNKYRLVVLNNESLEEKTFIILSPLNIFLIAASVVILIITMVVLTISFTPLKEFIPGYADVTLRKTVLDLALKTDSMELLIAQKNRYLSNFYNILTGDSIEEQYITGNTTNSIETKINYTHSKEDSILRTIVTEDELYNINAKLNMKEERDINEYVFFPPLRGTIIDEYLSESNHYGVDIVSAEKEVIKATLDGTVILSDWTFETGWIIAIQHKSNIVSIYKHNSVLLQEVFNKVQAGDPIAIIGNSGELTTGPHLHFELWYNETPVNPLEYINF